jgi:hypothetical protein
MATVLALLVAFYFAWAPLKEYLRRARRPREVGAVEALRVYVKAQAEYRRGDYDGDGQLEYSDSLEELADLGLIPPEMANARGRGGIPYGGYLFRELKTIAGKPIDWQYDFAISAIPARYGKTGYRTFVVSTNGTIMGPDLGPGTGFVDDYPADPCAAGWIIPD